MTKEKIEEIQVKEDIQVAMVKADSFPNGVMEAHRKITFANTLLCFATILRDLMA
jgi:hypothetical protein